MSISAGLGGTVGAVPVGSVTAFAGATAPAGWLLCYGQTVSRTLYSGLFLTIGTAYGAGDGSTTFALPDLRGRVPAGLDNMGGVAANRLTSSVLSSSGIGATGGTETHTLLETQMPSHTHTQNAHTHSQNNFGVANAVSGSFESNGFVVGGAGVDRQGGGRGNGNTTATNNYTGGGQAHLNTQPTIVLNYIIRAQ